MQINWRIPLLFIGTISMIVVMGKTSAPLKTASTYKNILWLELAYNNEKTGDILKDWGSSNIEVAKTNTYFDFIFIFCYTLFLFFTCKKTALISKSKTGIWIARGALWAGFLDVLENAGMLATLSGNRAEGIAFATAFCSAIKWVLVIIAVVYLLAGLKQLLISRKMRLLFS
jgi:hypothetical protein